MVRRQSSEIHLRVGDEQWPALPFSAQRSPRAARSMVSAWMDLETRGLKLRSRALTNTLYARLFLADLFIHGIGGGKYDELTDEIVRRFYGIEPPRFLVLSATLLLPLPTYPASEENQRQLSRAIRDLSYNPQRHLDANHPKYRELIAQKRTWIDRKPGSRRTRRERFQVLRALTEQLRESLGDQIADVERRLTESDRQLQANAILQRRDYAFCLYPEDQLRRFCTRFL